MRIVGRIKNIKGKKVEFIPVDVFPENTKYFKKIKNKKIEIENTGNFKKGDIIVLEEDISHKLLYSKIRTRKNMIFVPERGKHYVALENSYIKALIDPEKGGRVDYLLDKNKKFEWFFDDFVYIEGKPGRCGISQGLNNKSIYEKKLDYKITKKKFYGKRKGKNFIFEKLIEVNKNRLISLFRVTPKKDKEFYPFFDIKVFTGGEIYKYFLKIKKGTEKIEFPHMAYPFVVWGYIEEFGKIDKIRYENQKKYLTITPQKRNLLTFSFYYGFNYFVNRFYYKKIKGKKGKKFELKLEVKI